MWHKFFFPIILGFVLAVIPVAAQVKLSPPPMALPLSPPTGSVSLPTPARPVIDLTVANALADRARDASLGGKWIMAVTLYRQALQLNTQAPELWNNLGVALRKTGQRPAAVTAYRKAIALAPQFAEAYSNLSVVEAEQGNLKGALASARQAVKLDAANPVALLNVAFVLEQQEAWKPAATTYSGYMKKFGESGRVRYRLAVCQQRLGQLEEATWQLQRALEQDPNNQDYRLALGQLYYQIGNPKLALRYLDGLTNIDDPNALELLGRLSYGSGRYNQAVLALQKVTTLKGGDAQLLNDLGVSLARTDKLTAAQQALEQALSINPDFAQAWANIGYVQKRLGKPEQSILSYRKALELDTKMPTAFNNLGSLLLSQKKTSEAIENFQQAITIDPDYWEAHRNLTLAYAFAGNVTKAQEEGTLALREAHNSEQFLQSNHDLSDLQTINLIGLTPPSLKRTPRQP